MTPSTNTLWKLRGHTKAKHDILRKYLAAWFPILGSKYGRIVYVDGFCGPGQYEGGEPGSPIIALNAALDHERDIEEAVFWFIDEKEDRIDHLKRAIGELPVPTHFTVHQKVGTFKSQFKEMMNSMHKEDAQLTPTFAFVDPFGFSGIPFELIENLLKHPHCEVFINVMMGHLNRFFDHLVQSAPARIVEVFGTEAVLSMSSDGNEREEELRELYLSRLQDAAKFAHYFRMQNKKNRTICYLFFATNHRLGNLKMKEAMWKVDPDGEFTFSDATDPNARSLFDTDNTPVLTKEMHKEFDSMGFVTGGDVREFVEDKTKFLKRHMTKALKAEERIGGVTVKPLKTNGQKRRKGTFPDDMQLQFVAAEDNQSPE